MSRKIVAAKRTQPDKHTSTLNTDTSNAGPPTPHVSTLPPPLPQPFFEYCDTEAVETDLMCPVCLAPAFEPMTHVPCGRMFCTACLSQCVDCPLCRRPFTVADDTQVVKTRYILQKLDDIPVYCPVCRQKFQRAALASHLSCCPVPCDRACGASVAPKDREHHLGFACPCVEVECPNADVGCGWKNKRSEREAHHVICAFTPLRSALLVYQQHILEHQQTILLQQKNISELQADNRLLAEVVRHLLLQRPIDMLHLDDEGFLLKKLEPEPYSHVTDVEKQRASDLKLLKARFFPPDTPTDANKLKK